MTPKDFEAICEANQDLFALKNEQYGDAVEETGLLGATIELIGCVARLRKLVLAHGGIPVETNISAIANVLDDAHNYANIAKHMLFTQNWRGRPPIDLEFEATIDNVPLNG